MATHIVLINFTEQGMRNIKDSPARAHAFKDVAKRLGVEVEGVYWTSGRFDGVLLMKAPDDETAEAVTLTLGKSGNVHSQTLKAYDQPAMEKILGKL